MGDYVRTTRECTLDSLRPDLAAAIREHIEKYELGKLEASVLLCCETTSTKQKKGLFGSSPEVTYSGVMVTPQWLVWAAGTGKDKVGVLSARLRDILALDYQKSPEYKLMPDSGVDIQGRYTNAVEVSSSFIGLGPEPAAGKFRNILREAILKVNR